MARIGALGLLLVVVVLALEERGARAKDRATRLRLAGEEYRRLADLRHQGKITQEGYEIRKADIIARL